MCGSRLPHLNIGSSDFIDHLRAEMLHLAFEPAEFLDRGGLTIAHYNISFMPNDRLNKFSDGFAGILIVAIGVDYDVGAMLERIVNAITERTRQTHWLGMTYEMLNA